MTKIDVLKSCSISGNVVKLPDTQLERKLYQEVAKAIELIGGKWNRQYVGFVFKENPTLLMADISNGDKRNLKKEFQFFATPSHIADKLLVLSEINEYDLILEPSAGQGAIINAIQKKHKNANVNYCELMDINRTFLSKIPNTTYITDNFLRVPTNKTFIGIFHKIIANPPFSENQDIDHVKAMWELLAVGGRIVSIMSKHWQFSQNKKESNFRNWLNEINADIINLDAGEFKESGTNIPTCIVIIDKI